MARHYKRFEQHSQRWQREARKEGLTPQRWNGWLRLSDKTRKETDPRKYAAGHGIAAQRVERKQQLAERAIMRAAGNRGRKSSVHRNVGKMREGDLDWTIKTGPENIRKRASLKSVPGYAFNPWMYR